MNGANGQLGRRKLTPELEVELIRLYRLHLATAPKKLAAQFKLSVSGVKVYIDRARKRNWRVQD